MAFELGPEDRRRILRTSIPYEIWETLSTNRIFNIISGSFLGINRRDFFILAKEVRQELSNLSLLQDLNPTERIPLGYTTPASGINLSRNFLYKTIAIGYDPKLDKTIIVPHNITSDRLLTVEEVQRLTTEHFENPPGQSTPLEDIQVTIESVLQSDNFDAALL